MSVDPEQLKRELEHFVGSENQWRHSLARALRYTDGVKHFVTQAKAYWLLDAIAFGVNGRRGIFPGIVPRKEAFAIVVLTVRDSSARLRAYSDTKPDGSYDEKKRLYTAVIEYTDCPPGEWKFYLSGQGSTVMFMLPGEY